MDNSSMKNYCEGMPNIDVCTECTELKEIIDKLQRENGQLKAREELLKKNMSSLYHTAKREIENLKHQLSLERQQREDCDWCRLRFQHSLQMRTIETSQTDVNSNFLAEENMSFDNTEHRYDTLQDCRKPDRYFIEQK